MSMPFRTHIGRDIDVRLPSNLAVLILSLVAGGVALVLWLNGDPLSILLAPVYVFLFWALMREIDPDHYWTAFTSGVVAGAWVLVGLPIVSVLAVGTMVLAGRLVTETTGHRPLPVDLAVTAVVGIGVSFTLEGWIAGFGLAIAIYLDDRLALDSRGIQVGAAAVTALGSTVVATAAQVLPRVLPELVPYIVIPVGLIVLVLVVRHPADPICEVDAMHGAFVRKERLHSSRALIGILVFATTLLVGPEAEEMVPLAGALLLAVLSNEIEQVRRPDL